MCPVIFSANEGLLIGRTFLDLDGSIHGQRTNLALDTRDGIFSSQQWEPIEGPKMCYLRCSIVLSCSVVPALCEFWTVARQAPLSMRFSRQGYWSVLPFPSPGDLPDPGTEPVPLASSALSAGCITTSAIGRSPK